MSAKHTLPPLFSEFKPLPKEEWERLVQVIIDEPNLEKLNWQYQDGLDFPPYFTTEETKEFRYIKALDFKPPKHKIGHRWLRKWLLLEKITIEDENKANHQALHALENGAEGVVFEIINDNEINWQNLLQNIKPEHCNLSFVVNTGRQECGQQYLNYLNDRGIDLSKVNGHFLMPFSSHPSEFLESQLKHFELFKTAVGIRSIDIDLKTFQKEDLGLIKEIALALSFLVELVDGLTAGGVEASQIFPRIQLTVPIGNDFFLEIAKLRALRFLIGQIAKEFPGTSYDPESINLHCISSLHTNLNEEATKILSNTLQALAAILGGCNSISLAPHDSQNQQYNQGSARIARNISLILREEVHLDKFMDPAAGSYYLENITHKLVEGSWNLFLKMEKVGGYTKFQENEYSLN